MYSNRAACYLKTNDWRECADDATSCLALNPKNTKALWRRAQAMQEMHRLDAALSDLIQLLSCDSLKSKARDTYAKRARELKDHLEGVSTSSKDDPALTALNVLRDGSATPRPKTFNFTRSDLRWRITCGHVVLFNVVVWKRCGNF